MNAYPDDANTLRSWLLSPDPRRQAILFLVSTTVFFLAGVTLALAIHYELLTPRGDRFSAETYGALFTMHGLFMMHLFLLPAVFGVLGNLSISAGPSGKAAFPRLGLLGWYLHLGGGGVLAYVLLSGGVATGFAFSYVPPAARGLAAAALAGSVLAVAGVLATGLNVALSAVRHGATWSGLRRGMEEPGRAFVGSGLLAAAVGAAAFALLMVSPGWGPLQGTYFEVGSRHLLLGGLGFGVYFGRLHRRWPELAGRPANERQGVAAARMILAGLLLLCLPQLVMGALEAPRRYNEYPPGLQAWQVVSAMGGFVVVAGCCLAFWSLFFARRPTDSP